MNTIETKRYKVRLVTQCFTIINVDVEFGEDPVKIAENAISKLNLHSPQVVPTIYVGGEGEVYRNAHIVSLYPATQEPNQNPVELGAREITGLPQEENNPF